MRQQESEEVRSLYAALSNQIAESNYALGIETARNLLTVLDSKPRLPGEIRAELHILDNDIATGLLRIWIRDKIAEMKKLLQPNVDDDSSGVERQLKLPSATIRIAGLRWDLQVAQRVTTER